MSTGRPELNSTASRIASLTGASAARSLWKSPPVKIDVNPSEGWKLVAVKKGFDDFGALGGEVAPYIAGIARPLPTGATSQSGSQTDASLVILLELRSLLSS